MSIRDIHGKEQEERRGEKTGKTGRSPAVNVYFKEKEYSALQRRAEKDGISCASYIRSELMISEPKRTPLPEVTALAGELERAAAALERAVSDTERAGCGDMSELRSALDVYRQVREKMEDILESGS